MLPQVPVTFLKGNSMSLSECLWHRRQFLETRCPVDLEKSPTKSQGRMESIDVLPGDFEGEAYCNMVKLTGGPDLGSRASVRGYLGAFVGSAR